MILGAIADDVTGATDLASVIRRAGLRVVQTLGVPDGPPPDADAVVVSMKTRTVASGEACSAASAAADALGQAGAEVFFFKYCSTFDSTDQGNIGPVIETLMEQLEVPFTIACPSYPALRRTVYLGHLFVGDTLLSESSMRSHPLTPMRDANLVRVLGRQFRGSVGLVTVEAVEAGPAAIRSRYAALREGGSGVAIVDAVFDHHLRNIAEASIGMRLVTGGAGLGGALAAALAGDRSPGSPRSELEPPSAPVAFLSGSCSAATLAQVQRLAGVVPTRVLDPVALADDPEEVDRLLDWAADQAERGHHLLIHSTASTDLVEQAQARLGRGAAAARVEETFRLVARILADRGVRTFIVAGGETSGAVLQALDIRSIGFGDDLEPGVPWTYSIEPGGYTLALKSGNFGGPEFFLKALEAVR